MKKRNLIAFGGARVCLLYLLAGLLAMACANRGGGPQGGPKDIAPPIPLKSVPVNGAKNSMPKNIEISFNEIVTLDKAYEKVVLSPPQKQVPIVKAFGRKVIVEFGDSLKANTTYVIDFSDAIMDNNEKNPLLDYYFTFSTGNVLDSLMIGGTLLEAKSLNPVAGVLIGIHANLADSAFTSFPFDRISKTDKNGKFWIKGVSSGTYKVYALGDLNGDYRFDQPGESIAFLDSIIVPSVSYAEHMDTIWKDSVTIDTVRLESHPTYAPSNIELLYFQEKFERQYLLKADRPDSTRLSLYFNAPVDSLPTIKPHNFLFNRNYLLQVNPTRDSLTYWFSDSMVWRSDTLVYELTYQKTDSLNQLTWQVDSMSTVLVHKKAQEKSSGRKKRDEDQPKKQEFLTMKSNMNSTFDVYNPILFNFDVPTLFDTTKLPVCEVLVDTLWKPVNALFEKADSLGMKYSLSFTWLPEQSYRVTIDSAAFWGFTGMPTNKFESKMKVKSLDTYAILYVLMDYLKGNEVIQLLDKNDNVVRSLPAAKETVFEYMTPGEYYMRLFVDENGDKLWTSGEYAVKKQAERVYYFPYKLTLRAFWEIEENWDYRSTPLFNQKPKELIEVSSKKKK